MAGNPDNADALFTDLYQLTMAQAYWKSGNTAEATFSLFIRNYRRTAATSWPPALRTRSTIWKTCGSPGRT